MSAKIFDPLGLISPFIVRLKMLFQTLCTKGQSWDEPLIDNALEQWNQLANELQTLDRIRIPRCYFLSNFNPIDVQLHGFSDASEHAYAAAVYLRSAYEDGTVISRLVASKTRASPVMKQSTPRLELLGSLILARLVDTILTSRSRKIETVYWVNSMSVLFWIKNEKPWKQYIANRVREIQQLTSREQWKHCPGPLNPMDLPSHGLTWWEGPPFLCLSDDEWPCEVASTMDDVISKEIMKNPPSVTHVLTVSGKFSFKLDTVIDVMQFSKLDLLLHVTARVFYNSQTMDYNQETVN